MWVVLSSDHFKQDIVHQEIAQLWEELWKNILLFKQREKSKIKDFSDKIIELINQIIEKSIENFQNSWENMPSKSLSKQEEIDIIESSKNIFNEMLIKALLLNEWMNRIEAKNKTNIWDEARLLYIKDMLVSYEEKIIWLLKDFTKTKKYNF